MTVERPARRTIPSPDARSAHSPFRGHTGTFLDFWDTGTRKARTGLTVNPNAVNGETFTIDDGGPNEKTWTLQAALTNVDGNIQIGATREDTHDNIIAAINLDPAGSGTQYAAAMTAQGDVFAEINPSGSGITMFIVALVPGIGGNSILVSDTMGVGFGGSQLDFGMNGVVAFVPIVQWSSIRIRVEIDDDFGELIARFVRPARNKNPLGEPSPLLDGQADDEAFFYTVDQPTIDETFLTGGAELSLEIPATEHIGENWLKLVVSVREPATTVLDFCDISGVLLGLHH